MAFKQAEIQADAEISDFLSGCISLKRNGEVGEQIKKMAVRTADGNAFQEPEMHNLTAGYQSLQKLQSHVVLSGNTCKVVGETSDNRQPIIGVIRMWSAVREQTMRNLPDKPSSAPDTNAPALSGRGPVQSERKLMDPTDF